MGFFNRAPKTQKYVVRYSRADGHYREINLRATSEQHATEVAEQRLHEQFGNGVYERELREQAAAGDGRELAEANVLRQNPDLHQDNYGLESVRVIG